MSKKKKKTSRAQRKVENLKAAKAGMKIEKPHKVAPLPEVASARDRDDDDDSASERSPSRSTKDAKPARAARKRPSFLVIAGLIGGAAVLTYAGQSLFSKKDTTATAPTATATANAAPPKENEGPTIPANVPSPAAPRVIEPTREPEPPTPSPSPSPPTAGTTKPAATSAPAAKPKPAAAAPSKPAAAPKPKAKPASDDPY